MAMTAKRDAGDVMSELNITPLIDVMLVLLTLLLITLPIQTDAVNLDLPSHTKPLVQPRVVDVYVDFDGRVFWNNRPVDSATLETDLTRAAGENPQPEIHVTANRLAPYDAVAKTLATAQRDGVRRIGIVGTQAYMH